MLEGRRVRALPDQDDEHRRGQPPRPSVAEQGRAGASGESQVQSRLLLVGEPADVRHQPRTDVLGQGSQRIAAGAERREQPRGIPLGGGPGSDPERGLGDDPERALTADHDVEQARAGRRRGSTSSEHELAARRREPHPEHDVVDAAVARRRLTGRSRGDVAAQRRLLVALRIVPERQAVRLEGPLDVGPAQPGLEGRDAGLPVDAEQQVQPPQVEGDDACEPAPRRPRRLPRRRRHSCHRRRARPRCGGRCTPRAAAAPARHRPAGRRHRARATRRRAAAATGRGSPCPPHARRASGDRCARSRHRRRPAAQPAPCRPGRSAAGRHPRARRAATSGPRAMPSDPSIDHPAALRGCASAGSPQPCQTERRMERVSSSMAPARTRSPAVARETQFAWATRSHMHRIGTV